MTDFVSIPRTELEALRARAGGGATPLLEREFNRALLESMSDGVVACDADGVLTLFNRAAREWHGLDPLRLPPEEWPSHYDLYRADGVTPLPPEEVPLARAYRGETVVDVGMAIAARGQPVRYVTANAGVVRDEAGRMLGAVAVMRDVTELRRVETALRQANDALEARVRERTTQLEQQYLTLRGILDGVAAPIFSVDRQYRYTSFNARHAEAMAASYGVRIEPGQRMLDGMTAPEDRALAQRNVDRALAGETFAIEAFAGESPRARPYIRVLHSPIRDASGEIVGVAVVSHDLTARRQAEERLRESEQRYRDVFDNVLDGLFLLEVLEDGRFRTVEANPALERLTGISRSASLGRTQEEIVPPDTARRVNDKYRRCVAKGEPTVEELALDLPTGRRQFQSSLIPTRGADGRVARIVGISRDVTDLRQAEESQRAHLRLLEAMDRVSRALQASSDLELALGDVLDVVLELLACDRAFLLYPGDPDAPSWSCPVERCRPGFPGVRELGRELPMDPEVAETLRVLLAADDPVAFGPGSPHPLPAGIATSFGIRSFLSVAIRPRVGRPWQFGVHQCSSERRWSAEDQQLVREIGRRLGDALTVLLTVRDLQESEARYRRLNRELRALSSCNQALLRISEEQPLLTEVCRIVCEEAGYPLAWVGFPEDADARTVRPVAWAGEGAEALLSMFRSGPGGTPHDGGPAGVAIRTGVPVPVRDVACDPLVAPWRDAALAHGCRSALALPLRSGGDRAFGAFVVCSGAPDAVTPEERRLLEELVNDLALGVSALRSRTQRERAETALRAQDRDRRAAEEALRASEQQYRLVVSNAGEGILVVQGDAIRFTNAKAVELLGRSAEELTGASFAALVHPDDRASALGRRLGASDTGGARWGAARAASRDAAPFRVVDGAGRTRWVQLSTAETPWEDGAGTLCFLRDVTEAVNLEAQFRQAQKMEAVGRLAGGVAHDFNNMLLIIAGHVELALGALHPSDPLREDLAEIARAGERAAVLTRQLLAFSRKQVLSPQLLELRGLVGGIEKMLRRLIGEDVELVTELAPETWLIEADPGQIEQAVMNLATNARDAMPQGGRLTIRTDNVVFDEDYVGAHVGAAAGPHVRLAVSDTGSGMDPETLSRAFEPFFTTKEAGKGTGLGLATVYGIVRQSGGSIWVDSEPGRGTTFELYFPRAEGVLRPERPAAPVEEPGAGETVLVAEDEDALRSLIVRMLRKGRYEVMEARNGGEAFLLAERHPGPIHLLLTDVVMPQMDGRVLARRLCQLRPDLRVLLMSGYTDRVLEEDEAAASAFPLIQKPFGSGALRARIREILRSEA